MCRIRNTKIVLAVMYIPPDNSNFYDDIYFDNLQMILDYFHDDHLLVMGDLNTTFGDIHHEKLTYSMNPDGFINKHGRRLNDILQSNPNYFILNGLQTGNKYLESNFTFYRGKVCSQVDIVISNHIDTVDSFQILKKQIKSDHCPIQITCSTTMTADLHFIRECSERTFSYDHYDVKASE